MGTTTVVRCRKCSQSVTDAVERESINPRCDECKKRPIIYSRKGDFLDLRFTQLQKQGFVLQTFRGVLEGK